MLKTGNLLFGSTVTDVRLSKQALNDAGQLAFSYTLADGRNGIAVANTVPEPGSARVATGRGGRGGGAGG